MQGCSSKCKPNHSSKKNVPRDVVFLTGASPDPNVKPNSGPWKKRFLCNCFFFRSVVDHLFEVNGQFQAALSFYRSGTGLASGQPWCKYVNKLNHISTKQVINCFDLEIIFSNRLLIRMMLKYLGVRSCG